MNFLWKEEYNINIEKIDNQHKKLFDIGRSLYRIIMEGDNSKKENIGKVFKELKDYVLFHFHTEEKLMEENGYAHFQSHKNEHESFKKEIIRMENKSQTVAEEDLIKEIFNFIFTWILNHILKEDMKLKTLGLSIKN